MSDSENPAKDNLIADIFGDSDDEPAEPARAAQAASNDRTFLDSDNESLFGSSDDEDGKKQSGAKAATKMSKLRKGSAAAAASTAAASTARKPAAADDLQDSDDEVAPQRVQFDKRKKKRPLKEKKDKAKIPKRSRKEKGENKEKAESGDEYDSGEEVGKTKEDDDFIDQDDDHADLVEEYEEDNQDFSDERPRPGSKGKKAGTQPAAPRSTGKETDPLSIALAEMKAPKAKGLSAAEMEAFVEKLQLKMDRARKLDDQCYAKHEPAVHKLGLLTTVKQAVAMKALHNTLLDRDFLCTLRDWIKPRGHELPSLAVRSAVYGFLKELPVLTEHLKRGRGDEPIGFVIVKLRKHSAETPENKRILKDLMDRWSRPIYSNAIDSRGSAGMEEHEEVRMALSRQYQSAGPALASDTGRARIPISAGYLFTVQPESRAVDAKADGRMDEVRSALYKKTLEGKRSKGEAGAGKKTNPRAMSLSVTGRNVSV